VTQTNTDEDANADALASVEPERHRSRVLQYLLRRLRPEDAQDLAQEVFLRFLRLGRAEAVRDPQAYLLTIASHVLSEFHLRQQRGKVTYDSVLIEERAEELGDAGMLPVDEELDFARNIAAIDTACAELPYYQRLALILNLRDGLSKEDIAQRLGLTVNTVKTYLGKALAYCRDVWVPHDLEK